MKIPKSLDSIASRQERQGAKVFYKALKTQYAELAKQVENGQELKPNPTPVKNAIINFHTRVQLEMADWQYNILLAQTPVKALQVGVYERITNLIKTWITLNTGTSISSISNTTLDVVKRIIAQGQQDGFGARKIAQLIRAEAQDPFTVYRSTVISRTEGTRAAAQGAKFGAEQWEKITGQEKWKAWSASADSRTRDQHLEMLNSDPIKGSDNFIVGGAAMSAPGDPKGGKTNVINCRCRVYYMSERVAKRILGQKPPEEPQQLAPEDIEAPKPAEARTEQDIAADEQLIFEQIPKDFVEVYKQRYKEKYPMLEDSEGIAIFGYTGPEYRDINFYLRNREAMESARSFAKVDRNGYLRGMANQINKGLDKLPNYTGDVYRGTSNIKPTALDAYKKAFEKGLPHTEEAFLSTSETLQKSFGSQAIFKIKSKTGTSVKDLSLHANEDEVLFKHGTKFKVTSFKETGPKFDIRYEIEMEEL